MYFTDVLYMHVHVYLSFRGIQEKLDRAISPLGKEVFLKQLDWVGDMLKIRI